MLRFRFVMVVACGIHAAFVAVVGDVVERVGRLIQKSASEISRSSSYRCYVFSGPHNVSVVHKHAAHRDPQKSAGSPNRVR